MAKHDGDRPLSEEAEDLDDHARDLVSDLTEFDVRSDRQEHSSNLSKWLLILAAVLVLVFLLLSLTGSIWAGDEDGSEAPSDSGTATTVADQGGASNEQSSETAGPTSGTWEMYWTNIEGNERVAFTLRFMDDEYGTVEFPYDDKPYDARWDINGNQISFGFARDFDGPGWSVTEWSSFEGTLVNPDLITGNWLRDDWSCAPDDGCSKGPVPSKFDSRLVRQP